MSKSFTEVKRKQCNNCGKLFVTERHDCKFDPEKRNCLTCQHNLGQRICDSEAYFECAKGNDDGWTNLGDIISAHWKMNCKDWQLVELVERAHNVREAQNNKFRRITAEKLEEDKENLSKDIW